MFPFHYSSLNYELTQSTPSGSLNILWNQLNQKSIANSMMYMTPTFNLSIGYEYPEFGLYGNNLLNPMLAVQQTMQAFQNGSWMNGMNNFFNNWQMPWSNPWGTPGGGSTSGSNSEYDALKALITKYKEIGTKNNSLSPTLLDKINNALNKSGKPEEKLEALKELYKQLNKDKLEKALLELPEYKEALEAAGYKFSGTNKESDTKLKKELNSMEQEIKSKKADKLVLTTVSENNPQILRIISYWNDTHSSKENRGIIRLVANNLPEAKEEQIKHKEGIQNLAMSLINKVEDFKSETDGSFSKLDEAKEAVSKALTEVNKEFTKEKLMVLADKFDTLYAMLRMMEAEKIRNTINTKYGFLNDISSTDKNIADDNLVIEDTKADLKKEGINVDDIETDEIPEEDVEEISDIDERVETAEEKVEALIEEKELKNTEKEGVYTTTSTSSNEPAKLYMVKDDKLVELKGAKAIDKDGNCTMTDGSKKALNDVETVEVTAQDVINYNNTLERIDSLVKDGTISKCSTKLNGSTLYKSKGRQESGRAQYFIVRDNQLMQVICDYVTKDGNVVINGEIKPAKDLTSDNFSTISNSDIVTTDKQKEAEERKIKEGKEKKDAEEQKLEEIYKKEFQLHESEDGETYGNEIVDDLEWVTTQNEWDSAVDNINKINKDNVYSVIKGYEDDLNCGADHIIRQIRTENGRPDEKKMQLIVHIIDSVWGYCETYGTNSEDACRELYKLKVEIEKNPKQLIAKDIAEKLDSYILRIFNLN